jgi:hypothetical protein
MIMYFCSATTCIVHHGGEPGVFQIQEIALLVGAPRVSGIQEIALLLGAPSMSGRQEIALLLGAPRVSQIQEIAFACFCTHDHKLSTK